MNFVEFRQFGLNSTTIAFLGAVILSIIQGVFAWRQIMKIREKKSTKSIFIPCFMFYSIHFPCYAIYGFRHDYLAFIITGAILAVMYIMVLDTCVKHGGQVNMDLQIPVMIVFISVFIFVPHPYDDILMKIFYCIGTVFVLGSPYEIWRQKSPGSVDIGFLVIISGSIAFWLVYGIAVGNELVLVVNCAVSLAALAVTCYLYLLYSLYDGPVENEGAS